MIGVQGILANNLNAVKDATITASNVKAVANSVRRLSTLRQGNGLAALTGSYSGAADSIIDVEIIDEVATAPVISKPAFTGQGSGVLDSVAFTGSAQEFTVELADLGNVLTTAAANLDSVKVVARASGSAGNTISLTVDESTLVFTATAYSLIEDLKLGAKSTESNGFDWQSVVVGPDKVIPVTAKRVVFGADHSNIYLQYKTYEKGNWVYNFEPAIKRDVPKGTPVFFVTGGRTVTATDTVTPEMYTDIISLYDLLNAIQTTSALIKVEGVVANDRHPGGQGVKELNLRTEAFMAENSGSGSSYAKGFEDVVVNTNANTEIIEARCYAIAPQQDATARLGSELWELRGSVSGLLDAVLVTDELFTEIADRFTLRIPRALPVGYGGPRGRFSVVGINYQSRVSPAVPPPICVVAMNLGPSAVDQQVTLTYATKPSTTCDCSGMAVPNTQTPFLGLEGEVTVSAISERIKTAYNFRKGYYLAIYDSATPYANMNAAVTAFLLNFEADFASMIALLRELVDNEDSLLQWDVLYQDFVTEASEVISAVAGGTAVSDMILTTATVGYPIELTEGELTSIIVTDNVAAVVPSGLYTVDLVYGVLTFTGALTGYVLPLTVEMTRDPVRSKKSTPTTGNFYFQAAGGSGSKTLPTPYYDLTGVDTTNVRVFRSTVASNPAPLPPDPTTEILGLTNADIYEVDQFNGQIRFIHPSAFFLFADPVNRGVSRTAGNLFTNVVGAYPNPTGFYINGGVDVAANKIYFNFRQNEIVTVPTFTVQKMAGATAAVAPVAVTPGDLTRGIYGVETYEGYPYTVWILSNASSYLGTLNTTDQYHIVNTSTATVNVGSWYAYIHVRYSIPAVAIVGGVVTLDEDAYNERREAWSEWADAIRADAGKFDATTGETSVGDGSWRDYGDVFYWEVVGSVSGVYQRASNNRPYYSAKNSTSTNEFAFQINVKCPADLKVGDSITLSIGDAGLPATYQVGDSLILSTVAAQPLQLTGGVDGDDTQTWLVSGSVDGALPAYPLVTTTPTPYSQAGLDFLITPGAVPFDLSDKFTFTVEGGHWRWRKDTGTWSASAAIALTPVALSDGLSLTFTTGITPSFRTADIFSYRITQPHNPANVKRPTPLFWRWDGAGAVLTMTLGATKTITALAALHRLPAGATVAVEGGVGGYSWTENFTVTTGQNLLARFVNRTANQLRITVALATDGAIDWLWAGAELTTEYSAEVIWQRDYKLEHGAGFNPGSIYLGKAGSGEFKWDELPEADRVKLEALLDHVKQNGDEPMILFPQRARPEEAMLARIIPDQIDLEETYAYQTDQAVNRHYSLTLPLQGVFL